MWLELEKPLIDAWGRFVERKLSLTAIHSIQFNKKTERELTLLFSLGRMPRGKLLLFDREGNQEKNKREFEITLPGYPTPLGTKSFPLDENKIKERSERLYPVEVYEKLYKDSDENHSQK